MRRSGFIASAAAAVWSVATGSVFASGGSVVTRPPVFATPSRHSVRFSVPVREVLVTSDRGNTERVFVYQAGTRVAALRAGERVWVAPRVGVASAAGTQLVYAGAVT